VQVSGEEVMLDVVVRDKKGKLLSDLKPADFTVYDNGEQRQIKSFRFIQGTEESVAAAAAAGGAGARKQLDPLRQLRLITLVFQGLDANSAKLAREAAMQLLKGELTQNVYVSVMYIDNKLEAIQAFTNDRDLLKHGIEVATTPVNSHASENNRVRQQIATLLGRPESTGDASSAGTTSAVNDVATPSTASPNGSAMAAQVMQEMMYNIMQSAQSDIQTEWSRGTVYPLLDLVKEQYRLPGRKTILYFSPGFPLGQDTEDAFKSIISIANRSNVSFYCVDITGLTTWSSNQNSISAMNDAARNSRANVGSTGKPISMGQAEAEDKVIEAGMKDTQYNIGRLAKETGGDLIANTNDFRTPIRKVVEDAETYYEITYNPEIQKYDGSFRKVAVKTDVKDAQLLTRAGYFAMPPNLSPGEVLSPYEVPLLQAFDQQPLPRAFPFQSAALHFRGAANCKVIVDIPVGGVTLEDNKISGFFEGKVAYLAMVKDANGQVVRKFRQEIPLRVTADKLEAYKATSHFISNDAGFSLAPGRYTLDAAVIDLPSKKISARKSSFVVPAQSEQLGISSVIIVSSMREKDATAKPDDPLLMIDKIVLPRVNATLKKTEYASIPFYLTIYPDRKSAEKTTLRMEFSKDGTPVGAGSPPIGEPDASGRVQYVANAPTASLAPGNYQVRFVARQGSEEASETVTFTIE
jgi:VWFA-related protein